MGWAERSFPGHSVCSVAVVCAEEVMSERWRQRGWDSELSPRVLEELRWYRENGSLFQCVVDTSVNSPEENAEILHECCLGRQEV